MEMKIKLSHHHSWRPVRVCIRGPYQTIGDGCRVARSLSTAEWFWAKHQNENWVSQHLFISRVKCLWTKPTHTAMDLSVTLLCWCTVFWEMKYKFLIKTPCAFYPTSQCPDFSSSFLCIFLWHPIGYLRFPKAVILVPCQGLSPWLKRCACVCDLV